MELAKIMEMTLVTNMNTISEIDELIAAARKYRCACVFIMPCYLEYTVSALRDLPDVHVGGVMGFPYGMDFTSIKVAQTQKNIALGADELDMVINLGLLLSGENERVEDDIKACVDASEGKPVKCIIETPLLKEDDIKRASEIVARAGAAYIKTSTGFFRSDAGSAHVRAIRSAVGKRYDDQSRRRHPHPGPRSREFIEAGANRFGIGLQSAINILENSDEISEDY